MLIVNSFFFFYTLFFLIFIVIQLQLSAILNLITFTNGLRNDIEYASAVSTIISCWLTSCCRPPPTKCFSSFLSLSFLPLLRVPLAPNFWYCMELFSQIFLVFFFLFIFYTQNSLSRYFAKPKVIYCDAITM